MEDWYRLGHITKLISLWIAFFLTTLRLHGLHIWLEQLRLVHDYSHPSEHRLQSRSNRTACRCHDIQISEQQWNDYGINICRISTHTFDIADCILVTKLSRNMVTSSFAPFDDISTSFVKSIQSRPSVLSEIHMFCKAWFLSFLFLVFLRAFRLCGRGDVWGC